MTQYDFFRVEEIFIHSKKTLTGYVQSRYDVRERVIDPDRQPGVPLEQAAEEDDRDHVEGKTVRGVGRPVAAGRGRAVEGLRRDDLIENASQ